MKNEEFGSKKIVEVKTSDAKLFLTREEAEARCKELNEEE